jgi:hypothetical protein
LRTFPVNAFSQEGDFFIIGLYSAELLEFFGKPVVVIALGAEAHFGGRGDRPHAIKNLMELAGESPRLAFDISGTGFEELLCALVIAVRKSAHKAFHETLRSASSQRISAFCGSGLLARTLARWRTNLCATRRNDLRTGGNRQDEECTKSAHERGKRRP